MYSPSVKKIHSKKSSVSSKIISFSCPDIRFYNKRLDDEVHNNVLFKLEKNI